MWKERRRHRRRGNWVTPVILHLFYRCQWVRRVSPVFFSTPHSPSLVGACQTQQNRSNASVTDLQGREREVRPDGGVRERERERERHWQMQGNVYTNARAQATVVQQQIALTSFAFFLCFIFHSIVLSLKPLPVLLQNLWNKNHLYKYIKVSQIYDGNVYQGHNETFL